MGARPKTGHGVCLWLRQRSCRQPAALNRTAAGQARLGRADEALGIAGACCGCRLSGAQAIDEIGEAGLAGAAAPLGADDCLDLGDAATSPKQLDSPFRHLIGYDDEQYGRSSRSF